LFGFLWLLALFFLVVDVAVVEVLVQPADDLLLRVRHFEARHVYPVLEDLAARILGIPLVYIGPAPCEAAIIEVLQISHD